MKRNEKVKKYDEIVEIIEKWGGMRIGSLVVFDGLKIEDDDDFERLSELLDEVNPQIVDCEDEKNVLRLK